MTNKNFFREASSTQDTAFVEGDTSQFVGATKDNYDTTAIDAYRSGVEITLLKHFDAGTVKIHSGEPGHAYKQANFGSDHKLALTKPFEEEPLFDPQTLVNSVGQSTTLLMTFQEHVDGAIEPLSIRSLITFGGISGLLEPHDIHGTVMGGNTNSRGETDVVKSIYVIEKTSAPSAAFYDLQVDTLSNARADGNAHPSTLVGIFNDRRTDHMPFADKRLSRNVVQSANYDTDMITSISRLSGSTDNYVRSSMDEKSATSGFDFDFTSVGTDSLTFGGKTY